MEPLPGDIRQLIQDCEFFVTGLQDENLSRECFETRQLLLKNFRVIYNRYPQEFSFPLEGGHEEGSDDNRSSSLGRSAPSDDLSMGSDYQDEGAPEYKEIPAVAAQELSNILKQGYLEKKRRDHGLFRMEWQKRWCVLSNTIFYYFGSEKDKQQKGAFYINGYRAELVPNLRKDSKKSACFEMTAPGRRSYQFTASSTREARDWVDQINFVLKDLTSTLIPFDDDEEEEEEDEEETYDDIERATPPPRPMPVAAPAHLPHMGHASPHHPHPQPHPIAASHRRPEGWKNQDTMEDEEEDEEEEDIYEVLPEDDLSDGMEDGPDSRAKSASSDYANYYQGLWDCEADRADELAFQRGDLIYILSKSNDE
ncbi:src kinase-associated phosphoprotein 1 [Engraulis encrasicolus]|uniref:src kinase-associated phosphoprotein 1 n=1 Tax=Engraulis encrasicolus TaxID=184585 RepID=UPI002FD179BD